MVPPLKPVINAMKGYGILIKCYCIQPTLIPGRKGLGSALGLPVYTPVEGGISSVASGNNKGWAEYVDPVWERWQRDDHSYSNSFLLVDCVKQQRHIPRRPFLLHLQAAGFFTTQIDGGFFLPTSVQVPWAAFPVHFSFRLPTTLEIKDPWILIAAKRRTREELLLEQVEYGVKGQSDWATHSNFCWPFCKCVPHHITYRLFTCRQRATYWQ